MREIRLAHANLPVARPQVILRPSGASRGKVMVVGLALFPLWACHDPEPPPVTPAPPPEVARLSSDALTERVSMAVRGLRPTIAELDRASDPAGLEALVDVWLSTPEFGAMLRDLHADAWGLRIDGEEQWPPVGPLAKFSQADLATSLGEEPLKLVEDVVMSGRPYTDILLTNELMADEIVELANPITREAGEGWTHATWADGRPAAGILVSTALWRRYTTNLSGKHRQRGLFVAQRLLCDDLRARDFPVVPLEGIIDEAGIDDAVSTDPNCVSCHATLDPLSAFFWAFNDNLRGSDVSAAYDNGCVRNTADHCYPVHHYQPQDEGDWALYDLPAPGYYGQQAETLADLAVRIAADPRFPQCTARRFEAWFTDTPWNLVSDARADALTAVFTSSGLDARELVKAIVLSDEFASAAPEEGEGVPLLDVRPEAYARALEGLTGLTWSANPDHADCSAQGKCWGDSELMLGVRYGYRVLGGASDGVIIPATIGASPTRVAAYGALAAELAGGVVDADFAGTGTPHLLDRVGPTTDNEAEVRMQLAALHLRILGERVATDSDVVDETWTLWHGEASRSNPVTAWKVTIYALFTDPQMWLY